MMKEAGLLNVVYRTYSQGDHKADLTLYSFHDSSGAYEALDILRFHLVKEERGDVSAQTIYRSNQVLYIEGDAKFDDTFKSDAAKWVQSLSDGVAAPPIVSYLPTKDLQTGTDLYTLGPVGFTKMAGVLGSSDAAGLVDRAGFESGAEAIFGQYKSGKNTAMLLLIEYPTPQLAELHLKHMQRALLAAKGGASVERKGSLLSIVLAPTSQEYADALRASVNYETQVTWSEPGATATDPPWSSVLAKIFIGTFVFMVMAVVLGIAFGGVRVITKRLFPGKVFDRPHQIEVLQLGLSSKPIDPQDLY
jgi:hypothetical protein